MIGRDRTQAPLPPDRTVSHIRPPGRQPRSCRSGACPERHLNDHGAPELRVLIELHPIRPPLEPPRCRDGGAGNPAVRSRATAAGSRRCRPAGCGADSPPVAITQTPPCSSRADALPGIGGQLGDWKPPGVRDGGGGAIEGARPGPRNLRCHQTGGLELFDHMGGGVEGGFGAAVTGDCAPALGVRAGADRPPPRNRWDLVDVAGGGDSNCPTPSSSPAALVLEGIDAARTFGGPRRQAVMAACFDGSRRRRVAVRDAPRSGREPSGRQPGRTCYLPLKVRTWIVKIGGDEPGSCQAEQLLGPQA